MDVIAMFLPWLNAEFADGCGKQCRELHYLHILPTLELLWSMNIACPLVKSLELSCYMLNVDDSQYLLEI